MTAAAAALDPRVARTREVVLATAAELLVAEGFERITIEAIAEGSGVARSTIYRNWTTRTELLVDAFAQLISFADIPDLGSLDAELQLLGRELVAGLTAADWGRALPSLIGASAHDPELVEAQREFSERRRIIVAAVFDRAIARGELGDHADSMDLAEAFAAPFFFRRLLAHLPMDDALVERQIRLVRALASA